MLSDYRVLDLTDEKGFLCGKALGDLGADVIKIEKLGGDPARSIGPFYHDIPDPEKSLYWFAFNASKRGITLNIETTDGREIFKKLVKTADVVVDSFAPGYMDKLGLGYQVLSQINPGIIMTSITGFGREGPYRDYKAPDIVVWALSGVMYPVGDPDRPPLACSYPHVYFFGAMRAAIGTMVALFQRRTTGHGQQVEASAQQCAVWPSSSEVQAPWEMERKIWKRSGRNRIRLTTNVRAPSLWPCQDGDVGFSFMLGPSREKANRVLIDWIESEGMSSGILGQIDLMKTGWDDITEEWANQLYQVISDFFMKHTKMELFEGAVKRGIQLAPLLGARESLEFPQLLARDYWKEIEYPELGTTLTHPGPFARFSEATCGISRRAPLIGEHNQEIYEKELGLSREELVAMKQRRVI